MKLLIEIFNTARRFEFLGKSLFRGEKAFLCTENFQFNC